jgi:hypothetical protein
MAETARVWQILETLQARLQGISIANDYRTDAGADVRLEESSEEVSQRITIMAAHRSRPDDARSKGERELVVIVEAQVPVELGNAQELVIAIDEDIEQALDAFLPQPASLPLEFRESMYLSRPDGVPAMVLQHQYVTRFRR